MIHNTIEFLKTALNNYLLRKLPVESTGNGAGSDSSPEKVGYPNIESDPPVFQTGFVSLLLINIEDDKILRGAEQYVQMSPEGIKNRVSPPLRLELTLLVAAKFNDYFTALNHLSCSAQFFQAHPIFTADKFPRLPSGLDRLLVEFYSMGTSQKNEVWSSLKTAYLPSLVYKIKVLVFQEDLPSLETTISETTLKMDQR